MVYFSTSVLWLSVVTAAASVQAAGLDPFLTTRKVSASAAGAYGAEAAVEDPCRLGLPGLTIGLVEVVERALCHNPKTRHAWANAKIQAAVLGVRQAAYLPNASVTLSYGRHENRTEYKDVAGVAYSEMNSDVRPTVRSGSLKMSWVLTDFGQRSARVDEARALLDAANSTHDATLQAGFYEAAQAYFDALSALATLDAKREAERAARQSFLGAEAKYKAGVGALTDQLQAGTAYAQAKLERVVAEGGMKNAFGSLAIAMGLHVNAQFTLERPDAVLPDLAFVKPIEELIDVARRHHPALSAALADVKAAEADAAATRAEGRPIVALASEISRTDQLGQPPAVGYPPSDIEQTNASMAIQLNIPLFDGFGRAYRVRAAHSQIQAKQAEYSRTEEQVLLDLWRSYQQLVSETEGLKTTDDLVRNARHSYDVARGRYKAGVGNIVELLNVQSALAKAEQQRIQTVSNWHSARLRVAASTGQIGMWAITGLSRPPGS